MCAKKGSEAVSKLKQRNSPLGQDQMKFLCITERVHSHVHHLCVCPSELKNLIHKA